MPHITILRVSEDLSQDILLTSCKEISGKYVCPICPPKAKPKLFISVEILNHVKEHFNEARKTITWNGYKITTCHQACGLKVVRSHYHCPFCNELCNSKDYLTRKHATSCEGSHSAKQKGLKGISFDLTTSSPVFDHSNNRRSLGGNASNIIPRKGMKETVVNSPLAKPHSSLNTSSEELSMLNDIFSCRSPAPVTQVSNARKNSRESLHHDEPKALISTPIQREKLKPLISTPIHREKLKPLISDHIHSDFSPPVENSVAIVENKDARSIILNYLRSGDPTEFESAFRNFSVNYNKVDILMWINNMMDCAALLDRKADKLVLAFLKLNLFSSQECALMANSFIRTLVGHHNYYAYHVLKSLFLHLIPDMKDTSDEFLVSAGQITAEEEAMYERVVSSIIMINSDIPLTQDNLLGLASKSMPYFQQHVHKHAVYARNLLRLADSLPHLRVAVLEVIITNMITIDVHAPRSDLIEEECEDDMDSSDEEDMFDMEVEDMGQKTADPTLINTKDDSPLDTCQLPRAMTHRVGNTLDVLMSIMLQYVHDISHGVKTFPIPVYLQKISEATREHVIETDKCKPGIVNTGKSDAKKMGGCECGGVKHDIEALKTLYNDLKSVFSNIILRTHASAHVQFLLFYVLSLRPGLLPFFADFLINKKFKDINTSLCIRKNAMAYIGSLLARGKHISFMDVHTCLEAIRDWCSEYLDNQERTPERNYEDLTLHGPFYYACQTLFYVFTFRYKDYTENQRTLAMARSLNLERFVHSKLNPLLICSAPIVKNFALVAHRFQIAYCHIVLENNRRQTIPTACSDAFDEQETTLDLFFPFDPYLLQRSKLYIQNHYREFEGLPEDIGTDDAVMDVDGESLKTIISPESYDSMYGVSPGFVRFSEESIYC